MIDTYDGRRSCALAYLPVGATTHDSVRSSQLHTHLCGCSDVVLHDCPRLPSLSLHCVSHVLVCSTMPSLNRSRAIVRTRPSPRELVAVPRTQAGHRCSAAHIGLQVVCACSPARSNHEETKSTLMFANRCKTIVNKARSSVVPQREWPRGVHAHASAVCSFPAALWHCCAVHPMVTVSRKCCVER